MEVEEEAEREREGGSERERDYLLLHCHRHNDSCIKTGSDENYFINCEGQSHKTAQSTNHSLSEGRERKSRSGIEPRPFCLLTSLTPYGWAKAAPQTARPSP